MFHSLQTCRAIASLLVVVFHLGGTIALRKYSGFSPFAIPFAFGHAGVDFFFVLSGFIIVLVHRTDIGCPSHVFRYGAKRIARVFPMYWLVFAAVYGVAISVPSLAGTVPHDPGLVLRALLLLPLPTQEVGSTGAPVLVVAWSMQYEVFFYLVVALYIVSRNLGRLAVLLLFAAYLVGDRDWPFPLSFLIAGPWLIHFMLGALTAWAVSWRRAIGNPFLLAALGGCSFLLTGIIEVGFGSFSGASEWWSHLAYAASSALTIYGLVGLERNGVVFGGGKFAQLLGGASYTLYLIHFPLISATLKLAQFLGVLASPISAIIAYVSILLLCVGAAVTLHIHVERPTLEFLSSRLRAREMKRRL